MIQDENEIQISNIKYRKTKGFNVHIIGMHCNELLYNLLVIYGMLLCYKKVH